MPATLTQTMLKRAAADTQLDAERALAVLDQIAGAETTADQRAQIEQVRRSLRAIVDLWEPLAVGLRLSQVAERLDVSEPTVRKWLSEDLLDRVPERSPIEITPASVAHVEDVLEFVRERFPARTWSDRLAALLHDRDLRAQDWVREGVGQYERRELVDL